MIMLLPYTKCIITVLRLLSQISSSTLPLPRFFYIFSLVFYNWYQWYSFVSFYFCTCRQIFIVSLQILLMLHNSLLLLTVPLIIFVIPILEARTDGTATPTGKTTFSTVANLITRYIQVGSSANRVYSVEEPKLFDFSSFSTFVPYCGSGPRYRYIVTLLLKLPVDFKCFLTN